MNQDERDRFLRARLLLMISGSVFDRFAAWADLGDDYCEPLLVPLRSFAGVDRDSKQAVWKAVDDLIDEGLLAEFSEGVRDPDELNAVLGGASGGTTGGQHKSVTLGRSEILALTDVGEQESGRLSTTLVSLLDEFARSRMNLSIVDWYWLFRSHDHVDTHREWHYYKLTELTYRHANRVPPERGNLNSLLAELHPLYIAGYLTSDSEGYAAATIPNDAMPDWAARDRQWDETVRQAMKLTHDGREAARIALEVFASALQAAALKFVE
jgi:hypothetical protein